MRTKRIFAGRKRDIIWVAMVAAALSVPAAMADQASTAGLKKDVATALKKAKKASKKAGNANKRSKNALAVAEATSKLQGPQGEKGDTGEQGPSGVASIVTRVSSVQVAGGMSSNNTAATCNDGETVVSGGVDAPGLVIQFSFPSDDGGVNPTPDGGITDSWYGQAFNATADPLTLNVFVLCAVPPAG